MRRTLLVCLGLGLVAMGCGQSGPGSSGQTRVVQVDGTPEGINAFALAYFPSSVTVRAGDTVRFEQVYTGEPHSVTLGRMVDGVIPDAKRAMAAGGPPPAELAAKLETLPGMLPEGPGDANQVAVNPCFVKDALPSDATKPCPATSQPAFDGSFAYYSSGYIGPGEAFDVELAKDTPAGTYAYYCNLHGASMSGVINVVEAGTDIPDSEAVKAAGDKEMDEFFAPLVKAYKEASEGKTPFGNLAGYMSQDQENGGIIEFLPGELKAKVGERVVWTVFGPHTITFNPKADAATLLVKAGDGTWHLSEKAVAPAGGPGQPPPPEGAGDDAEGPPGDGPPTPQLVDAGAFDGAGLRSSGLFLSFPGPGSFFSYAMTFEKAGTYRYVCLVHPKMTGTVVVEA